MSTPDQTYEQEAVNLMLASIGERPVNNLSTSQRLDVIRAVAALNEVNVQVQTRGWWFNAETKVRITPTADGEYLIDTDAISIDASDSLIDQFVQRGNKLYNTITNTTTGHTDDLYVDQIRLLPFDDLPQSARLYVARRAGVVYQARTVGSPTLYEFTNELAQEAYGLLQAEEVDHVDTNLTFAPGIRDAVYRR